MKPIPLINLASALEARGQLRRSLQAYFKGTEVHSAEMAQLMVEAFSKLDNAIELARLTNARLRDFNTSIPRVGYPPTAHDNELLPHVI